MTFQHFYGSNADPLTGKTPIQVRVKNGPMSAPTQSGVNGVLNAFLKTVRLSPAPNHQKTVTLPDGTTVRMRSKFDQVTVDVVVPQRVNETEEKEPFFGGIVISPYTITNEAEYLPAAPNTVEEVKSPLSEMVFGARPTVPTSRPSDPMTHLVVQIANNVPLNDSPVARGFIKIFRIKDPLLGPHVEVSSSPVRYLVSAKDDFSEFYLCGKKLRRVPPLPETLYTIARICARGFVPSSFEQAAAASGFLFVAVDKKLYGINTGTPSPAWELLATAVFDDNLLRANDFGDACTIVASPSGGAVLTCAGSNGAGVRSNFTVTMAAGGGMSGVITLMHDGTVEQVPQAVNYTATLSITGSNNFITSMGLSVALSVQEVTRTDEYTVGPGAMALFPDRFLGGSLPRYSANVTSITMDWLCNGSFDGWYVDPSTAIEYPQFTYNFTFEKVRSTLGGAQVTTTLYDGTLSERPGAPVAPIQNFSHTYPAAVDPLPADQVLRWEYTATDEHTGKMAWRRDAQRTGSRTQFPAQTGPSVGETMVFGFPGTPAGTYYGVGTRTLSFSALAHEYALLRPNGAQLVHYTSIAELFGTTPEWAGAFTEVESLATTDKYAELPSRGGGFTIGTPYQIAGGPFTVSGSPQIIQTEPFYYMFWISPVNISRGGINPIDGLAPYPTSGPGDTYSHVITFDASSPTSFNATDYAAYFFPNYADKPGFEFAPGSTVFVGPESGTQPATPNSDAFCPPKLSGAYSFIGYADRVLFDLRCNGYIAWSVVHTEMETGGDWARHFVAVIGNDVSQVPLRDVLDEWRNIGTPDPSSDLRYMFYEAPERVSLL